jgi:adenosylmethionine---8-amino-7-oxononanoate aminotransferase
MITARDKANIWHPYTQHQFGSLPMPIVSGQGAYLYDDKGNKYLDLISSWWVNLHGHSQADIAKAIYEQAQTLEHVIFAGFTHEPAVQLAEKLLEILPQSFTKVFYSDNGSTSVEVALKMAYQYWRNQGEKQRKRFMAFEKGYHGDTFGAMAVGKKSGYFTAFEDLFFSVDTFIYPGTWSDDADVIAKEQDSLEKISIHLEKHADETAAIILEPLIQGASGMNMCTERFLQNLEKLVKDYGILIIYDEVMTGFGRTGSDFACIKAQTVPDIICLSKGITGGFLPLAVTVCQEKIYSAFLGDSFANALIHGHSYTANPLGCAAALASYALLKSPHCSEQITRIEKVHRQALMELSELPYITKKRYCGTVAAFNVNQDDSYGSTASIKLRDEMAKQGILIRPIANVIYFLPPYCISENELMNAYDIVINVLQGVCA